MRTGSGERPCFEQQQGFRVKGGDGRKGEGVGVRVGGQEARGTVSGEKRAGKCNGSPTTVIH